jgi:hypothetical protein
MQQIRWCKDDWRLTFSAASCSKEDKVSPLLEEHKMSLRIGWREYLSLGTRKVMADRETVQWGNINCMLLSLYCASDHIKYAEKWGAYFSHEPDRKLIHNFKQKPWTEGATWGGDLDVRLWIILKRMLKEYTLRIWTRFIWLRLESSRGPLLSTVTNH